MSCSGARSVRFCEACPKKNQVFALHLHINCCLPNLSIGARTNRTEIYVLIGYFPDCPVQLSSIISRWNVWHFEPRLEKEQVRKRKIRGSVPGGRSFDSILTIALLQLRAPDNFSQRSNFAKMLGRLCMGTYIVLCLPAKLRHVGERLWCIVGKMAHLSSGMRKVISRIMRYLLFVFLVLVLSLMKTSRGTSKEGNSFSVSHF